MGGPIFSLFDYFAGRLDFIYVVINFFAVLVIIFVLFPFHECAHALAAKLLGDDTAERAGRLTLNPFAHIDPVGAIMMFLVSFGYAKPVPVNPRNCRKVSARAAMSLTAAAGPVSNIIIALIFIIGEKLCYKFMTYEMLSRSPAYYYIPFALDLIASLSVYLAVFNLFPIPPLDGSKILYFFLKNSQVVWFERHMNVIRWVFFALIFLPPRIISLIISFLSSYILMGLDLITGFIK